MITKYGDRAKWWSIAVDRPLLIDPILFYICSWQLQTAEKEWI